MAENRMTGHLSFSKFQGPQEHHEDCPAKDDGELMPGYGMAGGGMGSYMACSYCGAIRDKTEDHGE